MKGNTKQNNVDRKKPTIYKTCCPLLFCPTHQTPKISVSLLFHEFQRLGRLLTNLSFFLVSTLSPSLSLCLSLFFLEKERKGHLIHTLEIEGETEPINHLLQDEFCVLNTTSVICKRYEYGEDCGDVGCRGENSSKISFSLPTNRPHVLPPAGWLRGQPPTPPPITWRCFRGQHRCVNNPDALLW